MGSSRWVKINENPTVSLLTGSSVTVCSLLKLEEGFSPCFYDSYQVPQVAWSKIGLKANILLLLFFFQRTLDASLYFVLFINCFNLLADS